MKVFVDLDATLNRLQDRWLQLIAVMTGEQIALEDVTTWDRLAKPEYQAILRQPHLFRDLRVEPGAPEAIRQLLANGHEVFVVSAGRPHDYQDKHLWLLEHFTFIPERHIIFATCKAELARPGCILIDDGPHNVEAWRRRGGIGIIFGQPWNRSTPGPRITGWNDALVSAL